MYNEEIIFSETCYIHVSISDFKVSEHGGILKTTLGSCVSVVLYTNKENSICSMSHFLLPQATSAEKEKETPLRYGSRIIPLQIQEMQNLGIAKKDLLAKVSGGAAMFPLRENSNLADVGAENSNIALKILQQEKIPVVAKDIGGGSGRSIQFDPQTLKLKIVIFGEKTFYI